jgi:hypothetical protein
MLPQDKGVRVRERIQSSYDLIPICLLRLREFVCVCIQEGRGMRHTSTALYFYGASKKSLHKPRAKFINILFKINYSLNYYLQLLYLQFLHRTQLNF